MKKKDILPPLLNDMIARFHADSLLYYFDDFASWKEAETAASKWGQSYREKEILDRVAEAVEKVRSGEAVYEQDGVAYYEEKNEYELLAALYYILLREQHMVIADIGGALGSTYYRYVSKLPKDRLSWNIVEQKHYVEYGKTAITELDFYYSVEELFEKKNNINTVLLLSVLSYLEDPYEMLRKIIMRKPKYIVIDETAFNVDLKENEHIMLQHVPKSFYKAVYPAHIFNENKMKDIILREGYKQIFEWVYPGGNIPIRTAFGFKETVDKGFLFELSL